MKETQAKPLSYIDNDSKHYKTADMDFSLDKIKEKIDKQVEEAKFKEAESELLEEDEKAPLELIEKKQIEIELLYKNIMGLEKEKNDILKRIEEHYGKQGKEIRA